MASLILLRFWMKHFYPLLLLIFLCPVTIYAQVDLTTLQQDTLRKDTLPEIPRTVRGNDIKRQTDTFFVQPDSLKVQDSIRIQDSLRSVVFAADSIQKMAVKTPERILKEGTKKTFAGKEWLFYYLILLLIVFGLIRRAFDKYFYDLFRVFFRTTLKQRQTQEQLLQSPLPSVFMNAFFVLSGGLYANFLLVHFDLIIADNFWLQYLYCAIALGSIYIVKFIGLKLTGWMFNVSDATESYTFIVFIVNKVLGIFLLPFLLILAFSPEPLYSSAIVLSWFGIGLLLIYRFILSYSAVRKEVKLNSFHFILYILGFEVVPLLLIYKLLLLIF